MARPSLKAPKIRNNKPTPELPFLPPLSEEETRKAESDPIADVLGSGGEVTPEVVKAEAETAETPKVGNSGGGKKPTDPKALRRPQLRALAVLTEAEATSGASAITIDQMAKRAKISTSMLKQGMGAIDPEKRQQHDEIYGYRSLLTRGLVKVIEVEGENKYHLTANGAAKTEKIEDELKAIKKVKVNDAGLEKRTGPKTPIAGKVKPKKRPTKRTKANVEKVTEAVTA